MARQVRMVLIDDLDGSEAAETLAFGLDGNQFEIDLSSVHATALREALAPYVAAARRAPGLQPPTPRPRARGGRKRISTMEEIEAIKRGRSTN